MNKNPFNNPFRQGNGNQQDKSKKESEWGKVKFNPISRAAATERATPWAHFKNDLINQQSKGTSLENDANAKEILKKREENYRKNLILSKRKEPTQWEDFSNETQPESSSSLSKQKIENKKTNNNNNNDKNGQKKKNFQQISSSINNVAYRTDFDSKLLTSGQNMYIKRLITKNSALKNSGSLERAVKDLKVNGVIRKAKNKRKKK